MAFVPDGAGYHYYRHGWVLLPYNLYRRTAAVEGGEFAIGEDNVRLNSYSAWINASRATRMAVKDKPVSRSVCSVNSASVCS